MKKYQKNSHISNAICIALGITIGIDLLTYGIQGVTYTDCLNSNKIWEVLAIKKYSLYLLKERRRQ